MGRGGALSSKSPAGSATFGNRRLSARVNSSAQAQNQGDVAVDPKTKPRRRSAEQIAEDDRQKQKQHNAAAAQAQKSLKAAGRVEDDLRREDLERSEPRNRREENVALFLPPLGAQRRWL